MNWVRTLGIAVLLMASFTAGIWLAIARPGPLLPWDSTPVAADVTSAPSSTSAEPTPTIRTPYAGEVLAFGDYVLISVKRCLKKLDYEVDATTERRVTDAATDLRAREADIPGGVLIHLGANGGATAQDLDAIMQILGPDRTVVWTTIQIPDDPERYTFEQDTNAAIAGLAENYPNVRVFSWNAMSPTNPDWLNADGSMTKLGCQAFADFADRVMRG
ncbi:MAG: hypothetical protein ACO3ID_05640 [Candidatus Nanopelagicales bacterium]|jgi:hypothetical protein